MLCEPKPMLKGADFPQHQTLHVSIVLPLLVGLSLLAPFRAAMAQTNGLQYQIPTNEYNALVDLYNSTGGDAWMNQNGWLDGQATNWYGVTVAGVMYDAQGNVASTGNVQQLVLYGNQLAGNIPASLGNLAQLQYIDLDGNQLTGSIPDSLGDLAQLSYLDLDGNQLTGSIPDSLGNLTNLQSLYLNGNQLTGSIPASLGNLAQLYYLYLYDNQLTGSTPDGLGNLAQLQYLDLHGNLLMGSIPDSLGDLAQLQYLDLDGNQLTGSIPDSLGNLAKLYYLDLDGNQLAGGIPAGLGNLSQLQDLYLHDNLLTGSIPAGLGNLSLLQILDLHSNQFTGEVPDLSGLATGCYIDLSYNCLDLSPGSQSLANIGLMNAAGIDPVYLPQNPGCNPTPIPSLQGVTQTGNAINFTWTALPGLAYQIQYTTNLSQTNWINLGGQITATDITMTASDSITNDDQFYRIMQLP